MHINSHIQSIRNSGESWWIVVACSCTTRSRQFAGACCVIKQFRYVYGAQGLGGACARTLLLLIIWISEFEAPDLHRLHLLSDYPMCGVWGRVPRWGLRGATPIVPLSQILYLFEMQRMTDQINALPSHSGSGSTPRIFTIVGAMSLMDTFSRTLPASNAGPRAITGIVISSGISESWLRPCPP